MGIPQRSFRLPVADTLKAEAVARYLGGREAAESDPGDELARMVARGLDRLPQPGQGATLERWRALAAVGAHDLSLAKLYEAHTDALAILEELDESDAADRSRIWGVWCAEPPGAGVVAESTGDVSEVKLRGAKPWCSGAEAADSGLLSVRNDKGERLLAAVSLRQPGVRIDLEGWNAVGMARSRTATLHLDGVPARLVGGPGAYLERPGFWHGGAGVAACWYGAAQALGDALRQRARRSDAHAMAHLGTVDVALSSAADVLRSTAHWIDTYPQGDAQLLVLRARLVIEEACNLVLSHASRALGPGPLCSDAHLARLVADLPIYLRQSHAERDLQQLGEGLSTHGEATQWTL